MLMTHKPFLSVPEDPEDKQKHKTKTKATQKDPHSHFDIIYLSTKVVTG
jgi:hypothetical protein